MRNGIGSILHYLGGGSPKSPADYYGNKIASAKLIENEIIIGFENGKKIKIWDDGQSCCEQRYITTDDKPSDLVGQTLIKIETKDGPEVYRDEYEVHEQVFLEIQTDKGSVTFCTHNEHNGYYGGFGLSLDEVN